MNQVKWSTHHDIMTFFIILHNNSIFPLDDFLARNCPELIRKDCNKVVAKVINKGGNESGRKGSGLLHTSKRQQQPAGRSDRERKGKE